MNCKKTILLLLLFFCFDYQGFSQNQWDGDNNVGNFSYTNNWYGNNFPGTWNSSTDLSFEYSNQPQTSMYYDYNFFRQVRSIIYQNTFGRSLILDVMPGGGFDFWFKVENLSFFDQTLSIPLSGKGSIMELNPINAGLTFNNPIYNDVNINYNVYGDNGKILRINNELRGNASNNITLKEYSILDIGYNMAANCFGNGIQVDEGEVWFEQGAAINGGNINLGNGSSNYCKLYLRDMDGGSGLPNSISVNASSPNCFIGALNNAGTNTYAGNISLNSDVQLESFNGGRVAFSGNISGSNNVSIDDVGGFGNAVVQFTGTDKSYTGSTTIKAGATLQISSNQTLGSVTLETGATLLVDAGVSLTVTGWASSGTGTLVNNGTIRLNGPFSFPGANTTIIAMNTLQQEHVTAGSSTFLDHDITITGALILTQGIFNLAGKSLILNGASLQNSGGVLVGNSNSDLSVIGVGGGTVALQNDISLRHLTLGGSRTFQAPSGTLTLYGNITGSGTAVFQHNSGGVEINNLTTGQTYTAVNPFLFYELENKNPSAAGFLINSNLEIASVLGFGDASVLKLAAGNIYLISNQNRTASVGVIPASASIEYTGAGLFVVERYIRYTRKWHLLSVPVNSDQSIKDGWQDGGSPGAPLPAVTGYGVQITGPGGNPVTNGLDNISAAYSLKYQTGTTNTFTGVGNTLSPFASLPNFHKGFMLYAYGDRRAGAGTTAGPATVLRTRGKLFMANGVLADQPASVIVPVTLPGDLISVGNPFASPLSFSALRTANPTISPNFQVWDPSNLGSVGAGIYQSIDVNGNAFPGGGSIYNNNATDYRDIQSGQAFYVQAVGTSVLVPFLESMKSSSYRLATRGVENGPQNTGPADLRMISTFIHQASDDRLLDGNRVILDDSSSNNVNEQDAYKKMNDGANFGISKDGINLIVENRTMFRANDTVHFIINNLSVQNYRMKLAVQHINAAQLVASLVDRFTNTRTPVSLTDSSFINFAVTADAASKANNRFYLVFSAAVGGPLPVNIVSVTAVRKQDRTVAVSWKVENEFNITGYEVERSINGIQFSGVGTQAPLYNTAGGVYSLNDNDAPLHIVYYRIKATSVGGAVQYSAIVKVAGEKAAAVFAVYPNPASGNKINLQLANINAATTYQLSLFDAAGKLIHRETINALPGSSVISLDLQNELAAGNYQLQLRGTDKKIKTIQVVVQ